VGGGSAAEFVGAGPLAQPVLPRKFSVLVSVVKGCVGCHALRSTSLIAAA